MPCLPTLFAALLVTHAPQGLPLYGRGEASGFTNASSATLVRAMGSWQLPRRPRVASRQKTACPLQFPALLQNTSSLKPIRPESVKYDYCVFIWFNIIYSIILVLLYKVHHWEASAKWLCPDLMSSAIERIMGNDLLVTSVFCLWQPIAVV